MTSPKPPKNHRHQLLVEGLDDVATIGALLQRHGVSWPSTKWQPFIHDRGGIDELLDSIPLFLKGSYDVVGVVVDADTSLADQWTRVRDRFAAQGVELPPRASAHGTVVEANVGQVRRVGVWIMPTNDTDGMLEDFLAMLVPPGDPVWPIAERATSDAMTAGAKLRPAHQSKGCIHAYLAWQERSGMPFGTALTAEVLRHDEAIAQRFVQWLRNLYE